MALPRTAGHGPVRNPAQHVARGTTARLRSARGRHWTLLAGATVLSVVIAVLVLTPWIAPYDPAHQDLAQQLAGPGIHHWLGTDQLGRDVLSRLMYGGRFSVSIAAITLVISAVAGTIIGAFSARRGGIVDEAIMRAVDLLISIPDVVVALFLVAALGTGYGTIIAALTMVGWTPFARLMRGLALEINSRDYIEAAEALGCSKSFIIFRHVIPNALRSGDVDGLPAVRTQADHRRRTVVPRAGRAAPELRLGCHAAGSPALHGTRSPCWCWRPAPRSS